MIAEFVDDMEIEFENIDNVRKNGYGLFIELDDGREYNIVENADIAQTWAYDDLMDNSSLWQEAVANGDTEMGLEDWADWGIGIDGWESVISRYDGDYEITDSGYIYFRKN